ncbi:hypothetical protein J6590_095150 [Homalodisca vitripennis]|nr:hypothetical protein J6590_095150 [Homalodisca vitripennis]
MDMHLNAMGQLQAITGVPMAEWSKTLDFGPDLEIAQIQILSVTRCTFYQYHRPCTVSTLLLILFDKILAQASGP